MKNKKLMARIENFIKNWRESKNEDVFHLVKGSFYYTENPINDHYYGMRYYLCYHNTHTIMVSFKTQSEIEEFLLEYGF